MQIHNSRTSQFGEVYMKLKLFQSKSVKDRLISSAVSKLQSLHVFFCSEKSAMVAMVAMVGGVCKEIPSQ